MECITGDHVAHDDNEQLLEVAEQYRDNEEDLEITDLKK